MKKIAILILIDLALVTLLGAMTLIRWTGDSCLWFVGLLGRVGSPVARWTQDLLDYGERVLQRRASHPSHQSK